MADVIDLTKDCDRDTEESDYDEDDEGFSFQDFHPIDLDGLHWIANSKIEHLNLYLNYQPSWNGKEAFREFYQNWRDGMVHNFKIDERTFKTEYEERGKQIVIKAVHPTTKNLMGYIRYKWGKGTEDAKPHGTLELVNFKASLQLKHLGLGGTNKAEDSNQAGKFGEGMKLAALVMRRLNHTVRYHSSGFKWNYLVNKEGKLQVKLTRDKEATVRKERAKERERIDRHQPRLLKANSWEDVAVEIGSGRRCMNKDGTRERSHKILLDDFKEWLAITTDINPPSEIVRTDHGDLILDTNYQNTTYLKGLRLPNGSPSNKPYKFGYNFLNGATTRDRTSLASAKDEELTIASIWGAALTTEGETLSEDSFVAKYTHLLRMGLSGTVADVRNADTHASRATVEKVWKYMRNQNSTGENQSPPFYYCPFYGTDDTKIIRECLNMNPVPIGERFWKLIYNKHKLCRTPNEERTHRFQKAAESKLDTTCFARHMMKALAACLQSDPATAEMTFSFVEAENLDLDVIYLREEKKWRINDKWVSFDGAHEHTPCPLKYQDDPRLFLCDHAAATLFRIMIDELSAQDVPHTSLKDLRVRLETISYIRIPQVVRAVSLSAKPKALVVRWNSSGQLAMVPDHSHQQLLVILHRTDTCREKWRTAVFQEEESCDCPKQKVSLNCRKAFFDNLNAAQSYFPMICRAEHGSFYAVPPPAKFPLSAEETQDADLKIESSSEVELITIPSEDDSDAYSSGPFSPISRSSSEDSVLPPRTPSRTPTRQSPNRMSRTQSSPNFNQVLSQVREFAFKAREDLKVLNISKAPKSTWEILFGAQIDMKDLWQELYPGNYNWYRAVSKNGKSGLFAQPATSVVEIEENVDNTDDAINATLGELDRHILALQTHPKMEKRHRDLPPPQSGRTITVPIIPIPSRTSRATTQDSLYRLTPRPIRDQVSGHSSRIGNSGEDLIGSKQSMAPPSRTLRTDYKRPYCESTSSHDGASDQEEDSPSKRLRFS